MKYWVIGCWLFLLLVRCSAPQADNPNNGNNGVILDSVFEAYYEERLSLYPLQATSLGDSRYNSMLPNDLSEAYREKLKNFYAKYLDQIKAIDRATLNEAQQLNYDIFRWDMEINLEGFQYATHLLPVNQFWGLPLSFAQFGSGASDQPFKTEQDYDDFLGRINGFTVWVDTAIANMKKGIQQGVVQPKAIVVKVLPQYESFLVNKVEESLFYQPVQNMPDTFSDSTRTRLTQAYKAAIQEKVIPAYQRLYEFMKNTYLPASRASTGISDIPGGEAIYRYLVKYWTTTELSPDEIFERGQQEVSRIRQEMEKVKTEVGFEGSLQEFFNYLNTDQKFFPFDADEEVLAAYRAIEEKMKPHLPEYFSTFPKTAFEVRQTEAFREASASAEYQPGTLDGSRPGIFYVPILEPEEYNVTQMESLFLHEAIPGHHFQVSLQQEMEEVPGFRRINYYGAYGEGWALYCEGLGKELGLYTDPYQYFGRLSSEMHRAVRLVVDVGMHTKGWTREQAIAYSLENEAISEEEATAEIERYMVIPAQALSYKTGEMKILQLRQEARETMGDTFSMGAFHEEVLKEGGMPLEIMEAQIKQWMQEAL